MRAGKAGGAGPKHGAARSLGPVLTPSPSCLCAGLALTGFSICLMHSLHLSAGPAPGRSGATHPIAPIRRRDSFSESLGPDSDLLSLNHILISGPVTVASVFIFSDHTE